MEALDAAAASFETTVFLDHFKDLPDHRQAGKSDVSARRGAPFGGSGGRGGLHPDIARFGEKKLTLLRRFRPFTEGTPSHDHLGDIFATLDVQGFRRCFVAWVAALTKTPAELIAIDGKTSRRSGVKGSKEAIPMVSAFAARQRLVLAQTKVGEKLERNHWLFPLSSTCCRSKARSSPSTRWDASATSPRRSSTRRPITFWR